MGKVRIFCWSSGKFLRGQADSFEQIIYNELVKQMERNSTLYKKYNFDLLYKTVQELIDKNHPKYHKASYSQNLPPEEVVLNLFDEQLSLSFDFVKELKLYDVIKSDCFISNGDFGEQIKTLIAFCDLSFIINKRTWISFDYIDINLIACIEDLEDNILEKLKNTGSIYLGN